jgi:hypothetical protein
VRSTTNKQFFDNNLKIKRLPLQRRMTLIDSGNFKKQRHDPENKIDFLISNHDERN